MTRPAFFFILFCATLAAAAPIRAAAPQQETAPGDIILETGKTVTDVRCADLDGDGLGDLVVLTGSREGDPKDRSVILFLQKKKGAFQAAPLPPPWVKDAFFIDLGRYIEGPGNEILIVRKDSVALAGVRDGAPKLLVPSLPQSTLFEGSVHGVFAFLDSSFDLDGDGLDDPILPTDEELVALCKGLRRKFSISDPVAWGIERFENTFITVSAAVGKARVFPCPGKLPLVITEQKGKIVAFRFAPEKKAFIRMESDAGGFGSYGDAVKVGALEYSGTAVGDFFGGGGPSLVLSERSGRVGLLARIKTVHTFYTIGEDPAGGALVLKARQRIANAGIAAKPTFSDLDHDGYDDLVLRFVEASVLAKFLEALLDRVVITCQAFLYHPKKGTFSFDPDWSRDVPVPSDCFQTVGIEGLAMLDSDYSGDGRPDLVIYDSDRLLFYRGERSSGLFSSKEVDFKSRPFFQAGGPFPGPLHTVDVDGDDRKEIVTAGGTIVRVIHVR